MPLGHPPTIKWFLVYVVTLCAMPYALCYFLIISDKGSCKLQKRKKRTLKIARRKETGKISDESPSKVGFLGSANVRLSQNVLSYP